MYWKQCGSVFRKRVSISIISHIFRISNEFNNFLASGCHFTQSITNPMEVLEECSDVAANLSLIKLGSEGDPDSGSKNQLVQNLMSFCEYITINPFNIFMADWTPTNRINSCKVWMYVIWSITCNPLNYNNYWKI